MIQYFSRLNFLEIRPQLFFGCNTEWTEETDAADVHLVTPTSSSSKAAAENNAENMLMIEDLGPGQKILLELEKAFGTQRTLHGRKRRQSGHALQAEARMMPPG